MCKQTNIKNRILFYRLGRSLLQIVLGVGLSMALVSTSYAAYDLIMGTTDPNATDEQSAIRELIDLAYSTPKGRARLALAAAFAQIAPWGAPKTPEPAPR